ncbi:uncharacterized protein LOC130135552 [Syzygium oleosum]|uniref:uncharacterized protein LOC130135552 n=1 Tax=Syzygium oleosum TaxID=219896 RepID=UPI0024B9F060|nr:uncharacterized protein LOC130135552 [Syzygium oleosum]
MAVGQATTAATGSAITGRAKQRQPHRRWSSKGDGGLGGKLGRWWRAAGGREWHGGVAGGRARPDGLAGGSAEPDRGGRGSELLLAREGEGGREEKGSRVGGTGWTDGAAAGRAAALGGRLAGWGGDER